MSLTDVVIVNEVLPHFCGTRVGFVYSLYEQSCHNDDIKWYLNMFSVILSLCTVIDCLRESQRYLLQYVFAIGTAACK